jgi:DNA-binding GntR family transcriptional regulator
MSNSNATYQQQAYDFIKNQIITLHLKPGEYIIDSQIASQLKISRTPAREAFHRLEKEGLLVYEARRGWKVYTLSLHDIHEIFDLKVAIEGMVARKAAECQDDGLRSDLREALNDMQAAVEKDNTSDWLKADFHLHDILFQMAGNERARSNITTLNDQWHRVRIGFVALQGRAKRSTEEHRSFISGVLNGDGAEAEKLMQAHLNNVREELVHLLVTMVLPFVEEGV